MADSASSCWSNLSCSAEIVSGSAPFIFRSMISASWSSDFWKPLRLSIAALHSLSPSLLSPSMFEYGMLLSLK